MFFYKKLKILYLDKEVWMYYSGSSFMLKTSDVLQQKCIYSNSHFMQQNMVQYKILVQKVS